MNHPMAVLRQATRQAHRHVDAIVSERLQDLTVEGYGDLLVDLAAAHLPLVREIGRHARVDARPVADLVAADLRALGRCLPDAVPSPGIVTSEATALGALYVIEGSAAGGPVVATMVRRRLGPDVPVAFLERARGDASWWSRFGDVVAVAVDGGVDPDVVSAAAVAAFDWFAAMLDPAGVSARRAPEPAS